MAVKYRYGQAGLETLAKQAGEAQAAQLQLERQWKKDMAEMDYKFRLAAEERSRLWELEKMEIASRNDFMRQEQKRQAEQDEFDLKVKRINEAVESGKFTPEEGKRFVQDAILKQAGIQTLTEREQRAAMLETRKDPLQELLKQKMGEDKATPVTGPSEQVPRVAPITQALSKTAPKDIPMKEGKFIVQHPDSGKQYLVPPGELPKYMEEGFVVEPKQSFWDKMNWLEQFGTLNQRLMEQAKETAAYWSPVGSTPKEETPQTPTSPQPFVGPYGVTFPKQQSVEESKSQWLKSMETVQADLDKLNKQISKAKDEAELERLRKSVVNKYRQFQVNMDLGYFK